VAGYFGTDQIPADFGPPWFVSRQTIADMNRACEVCRDDLTMRAGA